MAEKATQSSSVSLLSSLESFNTPPSPAAAETETETTDTIIIHSGPLTFEEVTSFKENPLTGEDSNESAPVSIIEGLPDESSYDVQAPIPTTSDPEFCPEETVPPQSTEETPIFPESSTASITDDATPPPFSISLQEGFPPEFTLGGDQESDILASLLKDEPLLEEDSFQEVSLPLEETLELPNEPPGLQDQDSSTPEILGMQEGLPPEFIENSTSEGYIQPILGRPSILADLEHFLQGLDRPAQQPEKCEEPSPESISPPRTSAPSPSLAPKPIAIPIEEEGMDESPTPMTEEGEHDLLQEIALLEEPDAFAFTDNFSLELPDDASLTAETEEPSDAFDPSVPEPLASTDTFEMPPPEDTISVVLDFASIQVNQQTEEQTALQPIETENLPVPALALTDNEPIISSPQDEADKLGDPIDVLYASSLAPSSEPSSTTAFPDLADSDALVAEAPPVLPDAGSYDTIESDSSTPPPQQVEKRISPNEAAFERLLKSILASAKNENAPFQVDSNQFPVQEEPILESISLITPKVEPTEPAKTESVFDASAPQPDETPAPEPEEPAPAPELIVSPEPEQAQEEEVIITPPIVKPALEPPAVVQTPPVAPPGKKRYVPLGPLPSEPGMVKIKSTPHGIEKASLTAAPPPTDTPPLSLDTPQPEVETAADEPITSCMEYPEPTIEEAKPTQPEQRDFAEAFDTASVMAKASPEEEATSNAVTIEEKEDVEPETLEIAPIDFNFTFDDNPFDFANNSNDLTNIDPDDTTLFQAPTATEFSQFNFEEDPESLAALNSDGIDILVSTSLVDGFKLMLIHYNGTYALMSDNGEQAVLLKSYQSNPLADDDQFVVTQETVLGNKVMYLARIGSWQGIITLENEEIKLQAEL